MEIHASTQYTYQSFRQDHLFTMYKGKYYKLKRKVILILVTIVFISSILSLILKKSDSLFLFFNLIVGFCLVMFMDFILPKIQYKKLKNILTIPVDYIFYENEFLVVDDNPQYSGTMTIKYSILYKVYETDESFYLYLNKRLDYHIIKDSISPEGIAELRTRLQINLERKKYLTCK